MKKFKFLIGAVILTVGATNFYFLEFSKETGAADLLTANIEAKASDGEWSWPWEDEKKEIERKESVQVYCTGSTSTTVTYVSLNAGGQVTGTGVMVNGVVQVTAGVQSGAWVQQTTTTGSSGFLATRVNCPTDGSSTCTPYNPCK